jgi:hypothetical protein
MRRIRYPGFALLVAALVLCGSYLGVASPTFAADQVAQGKSESVRPEVGKPLQAAQELMKTHKYREAMAKIAEADGASSKTAFESFLIQRMRGSVAAAAGDTDVAIKSFEASIASGRLTPAEQIKMVQAVAGLYYQSKEYSKSAQWAARYFKEGGSDSQMRTLLVQAYYLNNDCASVARHLGADAPSEEKNGRKPTEEELQILSNCYLKQKDNTGYVAALEKLVTYYPKKDYWVALINRVQKKPNYADRLSLDVYRLKRVTGNLTSTADYMEMSQLALQAGLPAEGKKIVDEGFAAGLLGTGAEADRHKRLRDLAEKTLAEDQKAIAANESEAAAAKDGNALVQSGFNYVAYGKYEKGVALMEKGIAVGGLKRPDDAKLHLGIALLAAGQRAKAMQVLRSVHGADGTADLARLWVIHSNRSAG